MQHLLQEETRKLIKHKSELCLSLFVPARNQEILRGSFVRLWNEAWSIAEDRFSIDQMEPVFSKIALNRVLEKYEDGFDTLCLFVSRKASYCVFLDSKVEPRVVVDSSFYVKPLISSISGDDQAWLLEVLDDHYVLSLTSLTGSLEYATVPRLNDDQVVNRELKSIVKILNSDSRPWFIAGPVELVTEARLELNRSKIKRYPKAHLLHSDRMKVAESAREVIRIHLKQDRESISRSIRMEDVHPISVASLSRAKLSQSNLKTLVVDEGGLPSLDAHSKIILPDLQEDDLKLDDLVEEAFDRNVKVVVVPNLRKRIGSPIAALKYAKG